MEELPIGRSHWRSDRRLADNLALLCHHHELKTYEGWTLEQSERTDSSAPEWTFTPQPPFGQESDPPDG